LTETLCTSPVQKYGRSVGSSGKTVNNIAVEYDFIDINAMIKTAAMHNE